jgi:hypothetical protein
MDIITNSSIELAALRQQLSDAWSEHPFPVDKIAKLNLDLRDTLIRFGMDHRPDLWRKPFIPLTPEELAAKRAKRKAYDIAYWKTRRKRIFI